MAPQQTPEPAEPGAARPDEFGHQKYDYVPTKPDGGIMGAIQNLGGTVLDASQRRQLEQGLSMRPAGHIPRTNAASYDHPELYNMIHSSKASQAHELGQMWNNLGNEIMDFGANLQRTATSSEAIWVGQAGNAARATLSGLANWSNTTGQSVQYMGTTVRTQAEAADTAKRSMPDPVHYDPAEYQARLHSTMNPIEWVQIVGDARQQADKQQAAHAEAVRVTETYGTALQDTSATMPAFAPPQEFGHGDTGLTPGAPMPGGGSGGAVPPAALPTARSAGRVPGGAPGIGGGSPPAAPGTAVAAPGVLPPPSTPGQAMSPGPRTPGGSDPAGPGAAANVVPAFSPIAAAGIGAAVGGAAQSETWTGGGRAAGARGGFGPRGSGGAGTSNPLGRSGSGPADATENAAGAGSGATGMAGRGAGTGTGAGGAAPPLAGAGRGRGEEDNEHRRPSYLVETEDVWGDGRRVAPPVIGEDPPEYYR